MRKGLILVLACTLFLALFSFMVSASESLGTFQQGEDIRISFNCFNATYFNLSSITYPNSSVALSDTQMDYFGNGEYNLTFSLSQDNGRYYVKAISDGCQNTFDYYFDITSNGNEASYNYLIAMVILILTFLGFGILIYWDKSKMDDEKYWNKMVMRWRDKNYLRFSATALWYNFKKNSYVLNYLIGLVIMLLIYDITLVYNLESVIQIFRILLGLYTFGALLVVMVFFGTVQEWIKEWQEELSKINWGEGFGNGK